VSLDSGMHVFFCVAKADAWEGQYVVDNVKKRDFTPSLIAGSINKLAHPRLIVQSNYELSENKQCITLDNSIALLYTVYIRRSHMKIIINHSSMQPIYEQITDQIKAMIIDGTLKEEEMLPSVRTLAKELKISALTVKKAYDFLEEEGFVVTVHGKGSFIAKNNQGLLMEERKREIETELEEVIRKARISGLSEEEIRELFELIMEE
jgi:GntR family transcriptional regulator